MFAKKPKIVHLPCSSIRSLSYRRPSPAPGSSTTVVPVSALRQALPTVPLQSTYLSHSGLALAVRRTELACILVTSGAVFVSGTGQPVAGAARPFQRPMTAYSHRERGPPRRGLGVNSKRAWNPKFVGPRCQACLRTFETDERRGAFHTLYEWTGQDPCVCRPTCTRKSSETQQLQVLPSNVIFIPYSGVSTFGLQVCRM